jgi:hypothetical protein
VFPFVVKMVCEWVKECSEPAAGDFQEAKLPLEIVVSQQLSHAAFAGPFARCLSAI